MKKFNLDTDVVVTTSPVIERVIFGRPRVGYGSSQGPPSSDDFILTGAASSISNVKTFSHWSVDGATGSYYNTVFDKVHTFKHSRPVFDVSWGCLWSLSGQPKTPLSESIPAAPSHVKDASERMYRFYAKTLLKDKNKYFVGKLGALGQDSLFTDMVFININRTQMKDKIRPGTFYLSTIASGTFDSLFVQVITDSGAREFKKDYYGDLGALRVVYDQTYTTTPEKDVIGVIDYDRGIVAINTLYFSFTGPEGEGNSWYVQNAVTRSFNDMCLDSYDHILQGVRQRLREIRFESISNRRVSYFNTTMERDEFNYSTNPTFKNKTGVISVTSGSNTAKTRTYVTSVGLLGENRELIAVAKLSKVVKKTPDLKIDIKVRMLV